MISIALLLLSAVSITAQDRSGQRRLRSNWLLPVCVPVDVSSSRVGELFAIGSITDGVATVFPVNSVMAGQPFVVRPNRDITIDSLLADGFTPVANVKYELPWHGGHILTDMDTYLWSYISETGDTVAGRQLQFNVMRPMDMDFCVNVENSVVRKYMREVSYERDDETVVDHYLSFPGERRDYPNAVAIPVAAAAGASSVSLTYCDSIAPDDIVTVNVDGSQASQERADFLNYPDVFRLYHLLPGHTYYYNITGDGEVVSKGTFHTLGQVRMINAPSVANIRDLGGWKTSNGGTIKFGKIYRGSELNGQHLCSDADLACLKELGIKAEIDLRHISEEGAGVSVFGFLTSSETADGEQPSFLFTNNSGCELEHFTYAGYFWQQRWRDEFNYIVNCLRADMPVYLHCIWGADRAGMLSMMLEALLGVSYSDIIKDYELTSFSEGARRKVSMDIVLGYFEQFDGATLQEKMEHYFVNKLYINLNKIEYFRAEMIENGSAQQQQPSHQPVVTGISDMTLKGGDRQSLRDLSGRRVVSPRHGIYIRGNKKIIF